MSQPIKIPDMGTAVETLTLVAWLKQEGDAVKVGDPLCEVEADKATVTVESQVEGVLLQQAVAVNDEFELGATLGYVGQSGEHVE